MSERTCWYCGREATHRHKGVDLCESHAHTRANTIVDGHRQSPQRTNP